MAAAASRAPLGKLTALLRPPRRTCQPVLGIKELQKTRKGKAVKKNPKLK